MVSTLGVSRSRPLTLSSIRPTPSSGGVFGYVVLRVSRTVLDSIEEDTSSPLSVVGKGSPDSTREGYSVKSGS